MSAPDLETYNRLVLQYQDEAYTLACDLLGEERPAAALVQAAFIAVYRRRKWLPGDGRLFRLHVLQHICAAPAGSGQEKSPALSGLEGLTLPARQALLLVDMLGLSYQEAGQVLNLPVTQVGRLLAQGRRAICGQAVA